MLHIAKIQTKYDATLFQDNVIIGKMPIMLRSCRCILHGKDEEELARLGWYLYPFFKHCFFLLITFIV